MEEVKKACKRLSLLLHPVGAEDEAKSCFPRVTRAKNEMLQQAEHAQQSARPTSERDGCGRFCDLVVTSLAWRFGATIQALDNEEQEIKLARDALNFWENPSFGSLTLMGPGLQLFRGDLKEVALEQGPAYHGCAWLTHLEGDSSLLRLTNSFRLFTNHTEAVVVRTRVLTARAQRNAGAAWQRFFFGPRAQLSHT